MSNSNSSPDDAIAKKAKKGKKNIFRKVFDNVLGGDFLAQDWALNQVKFLLFMTVLGVGYIANSYYIENVARKIDRTTREIKELQFEYILSKSKVMHESKQSEIARKLQKKGIKETTEPVNKIVVPKQSAK
jgi:hypothetical protein